jgi:hypothetical protein
MTLYQQARKLMRLRIYLIVGIVLLGVVASTVGDDLARLFIRPCAAPPDYRADVPAHVREQLDQLHANGLLYCSPPVEGLATMSEPIYWGSDGLTSVLFFQADDLAGLGVTRYGFGGGVTGTAFVPGEPGAAPPDGFRDAAAGRPALSNQAPPGSGFYYRVHGAPAAADTAVNVTLVGPARQAAGMGSRDVFRDLELAWNWLRRKPSRVLGDTTVRIPIGIVPERWEPHVRRSVTPELAGAGGEPTFRALTAAAPDQPTYYHVVGGLLTTTVWVAGVVSGTNPVVYLVDDAGRAREPQASARWTSAISDQILAHFAFEPLPPATAVEARYWADRRAAGTAPPDHVWPIAIP